MVSRKHQTEAASSIDLAQYADNHIFYEAQMSVRTRAGLQNASPGTFEMNAMVELCVLHFRKLLAFFYLPRSEPTDVVAADYVTRWQSQRPGMSPALKAARDRANTELAHLTSKRIAGTSPQKAWDFGILRNELKPAITTFVRAVDPLNVPQRTLAELQKI